jgi:hypothetical protein
MTLFGTGFLSPTGAVLDSGPMRWWCDTAFPGRLLSWQPAVSVCLPALRLGKQFKKYAGISWLDEVPLEPRAQAAFAGGAES